MQKVVTGPCVCVLFARATEGYGKLYKLFIYSINSIQDSKTGLETNL